MNDLNTNEPGAVIILIDEKGNTAFVVSGETTRYQEKIIKRIYAISKPSIFLLLMLYLEITVNTIDFYTSLWYNQIKLKYFTKNEDK